MFNRRLNFVAALGCCLVLFSTSACISVKAPERINIGNGSKGKDSRRANDRYDHNDKKYEYDYENDRKRHDHDEDDD